MRNEKTTRSLEGGATGGLSAYLEDTEAALGVAEPW